MDLIERIGRALYGADWRHALAAELCLSARSFRVWASGRSAIPAGIAEELLELLEERDTELAELRAELSVVIKSNAGNGGSDDQVR